MILFHLIVLRRSSAMPGTVQVSILELKGLPPSSSSSPTSIKVSMGKQEFETQEEKGEFTFSLTTLRDNLVVKIQDSEGNEIAHTGLESRLIAEKGFWDDMFPLEGGGQVHMRLIFSLSEEEQRRIRNMRESVLRKKREELLNKRHGIAEIEVASSGGKNFADSKEEHSSPTILLKANSLNHPQDAISKQSNSKPTSEVKLAHTFSSHPMSVKETISSPILQTEANVSSVQQGSTFKQPNLKPTITSEATEPSSPSLQLMSGEKEAPSPTTLMKANTMDLPKGYSSGEQDFNHVSEVNVHSLSPSSSHLKDDPIQLQPPKERTPSMKINSHVRKMINAFDTSRSVQQQQEISQGNSATSVSQTTRSNLGGHTQMPNSETIIKQKPRSAVSKFKRLPGVFLVDESQEYHTSFREKKGSGATCITLYRSKSHSRICNEAELEYESVSRMDDSELSKKENSRGVQHDKGKRPSRELRRSVSLDRHNCLERPIDLDIAKNQSYSSLVEQQCSSGASASTESRRGNNATHLQDVTEQTGLSSASDRGFLVGSCDWIFVDEEVSPCIVVGDNMLEGPLSDHPPTLISESYQAKVSRGENLPTGVKKHEESDGSSADGGSGPAGQVMKVAIMVGFGLFVLFTRQRKSK